MDHAAHVIFDIEPKPAVTTLGAKRFGEIGIVGSAAAIADAVYHATGSRVRLRPISMDMLIDAVSAVREPDMDERRDPGAVTSAEAGQ